MRPGYKSYIELCSLVTSQTQSYAAWLQVIHRVMQPGYKSYIELCSLVTSQTQSYATWLQVTHRVIKPCYKSNTELCNLVTFKSQSYSAWLLVTIFLIFSQAITAHPRRAVCRYLDCTFQMICFSDLSPCPIRTLIFASLFLLSV